MDLPGDGYGPVGDRDLLMTAVPYILIIGAVEEEISGLCSRMDPGAWTEEIGRRRVTGGTLHGGFVRLMATGPGMANTVQAVTAVLERVPPRLILQTGCAGAFAQSGMRVGDVGVADEEIDAHLGIEPDGPDDPPAALPFPVLTVNGTDVRGRYPVSRPWVQAALTALRHASRTAGEASGFKVVCGPFLTVSTITATDAGALRHFRRYGVCMEAMEGAGAAHAACHYGVPFLEIRAAGNIVGRRDRASWNLALAFRRSTWAVLAVLEHCRELLRENLK